MTGSTLTISGWATLHAAGTEDVSSLFEEPLPSGVAPVLTGFDVRARLGRKGTSFYDRATALAVVTCGMALDAGGVAVDDLTRPRIGVVLGTMVGSFKSTSDYSRDTLVQEKPYLVNPVLFPNSVMNCAAGQAAIRFGLRGVNATVAGGRLAFHHALRYADNTLGRHAADVMLVGAVEEYSPHRAWSTHLTAGRAAGEGAAVFVVERSGPACRPGGTPVAEILSVATGFGWKDLADDALAGCVRRALEAAGVDASEISVVVTGESAADDTSEYRPTVQALGREPERLTVSASLGECDAAAGALGMAVLVDRFSARPGSREAAVLTARTSDGGVAAAVVRGL